jgi:hypothetical protein
LASKRSRDTTQRSPVAAQIAVRAFEAHQFAFDGGKFDAYRFVFDDALRLGVLAQIDIFEFGHEAGGEAGERGNMTSGASAWCSGRGVGRGRGAL